MRARHLALDLPLSLLWALTLVAYVFLPETIPAHWGPSGLDRLGPKYELFFLPLVLTLLVVGGYALLQKGGQRDPAFLALFGFIAWLGVFLQGFTLALVLQSLASGAAPQLPTPKEVGASEIALRVILVLSGLVIATLGLSLWASPPRPNPCFGLRIRETLADPEVWYPANRYAGKVLVAAGVGGALAALLLPALLAALLLVALLLLAALLSIGRAKALARKKSERNPGP